eukprot:TRINITY_DN14831_c0_g1_i1.p1 TRINITY_DN14831_c0_g1~~TRINITY_DN14831_c0_g1_i1.p1  ORF type:complete len:222 (+),score=31.99 TRINITY_DN14831_c0_g1_i1:62-727(+)
MSVVANGSTSSVSSANVDEGVGAQAGVKKDSDFLAYCVAALCAVDVVLCMRIFHVRTIFGLVFSLCGLYGSASKRKSYVLMYVIHTSFTLVRGVIHTSTIVLTHLSVIKEKPLDGDADPEAAKRNLASMASIVILVALEAVELLIATIVYLFYTSVRDDEANRAEDYPPNSAGTPHELAGPDDAISDATTTPTINKLSPQPPPTGALSGLLRRRGKKVGRR